jgi:hypothetical protein
MTRSLYVQDMRWAFLLSYLPIGPNERRQRERWGSLKCTASEPFSAGFPVSLVVSPLLSSDRANYQCGFGLKTVYRPSGVTLCCDVATVRQSRFVVSECSTTYFMVGLWKAYSNHGG